MFYHFNFLQEPFLSPNLNILKFWGSLEVFNPRYEGNVPPYPLSQYIVRHCTVGPLILQS